MGRVTITPTADTGFGDALRAMPPTAKSWRPKTKHGSATVATLESKPFCDGHHKTVSFKNSRETKGHIVNEAQFIAVANDADLREGGLLGVDVDGTEVVLARVDGLLYAIGGVCTHQHARLADGEIWGRRVVCPLHGGEFELTTGCAARLPATESEPVYDVNVEGGKILVSKTPRS